MGLEGGADTSIVGHIGLSSTSRILITRTRGSVNIILGRSPPILLTNLTTFYSFTQTDFILNELF